MKRSNASSGGFSLLELMAVVAIIGILASIIVARTSLSTHKASEKTCQHNRAQLNSAIERFYIETGALPTNLSQLGTNYFPSGIPNCPVSGSAYQLNATGDRIDGHLGSSHP